nr:immunoglobulin light chain junction region [Macaca mulatta]
CLQYLSNPFTF